MSPSSWHQGQASKASPSKPPFPHPPTPKKTHNRSNSMRCMRTGYQKDSKRRDLVRLYSFSSPLPPSAPSPSSAPTFLVLVQVSFKPVRHPPGPWRLAWKPGGGFLGLGAPGTRFLGYSAPYIYTYTDACMHTCQTNNPRGKRAG